MKTKYYHWILVALFLITLSSRLFFAFQTPHFDPDAYFNLRQIEHIKQTGLPLYDDNLSYGGRTYIFPPFFHYTLTFFHLFLPIDYVGKIIPNLMISSLIFIVFLIAKKITKQDGAGLFAAFISAFVPVLFAETIFSVSELTLVIPLIFLSMYCLMNIKEKKYVYTYLVTITILSLTHTSTFFLILGLLLYLLISEVEIIKRNRAESELILFSTFVFFWIQSLFFKKAFLMHGVSLIWKNTPLSLLNQYFSQITIIGTITKVGWLPVFYGLYLMFKYILKEKNKYIYMYISFILPIVVFLWLKMIEPSLGWVFLGIPLSILFSEFYVRSLNYIKKTKFSKWKLVFVLSLTITFVVTSVVPAVYFAQNELRQTVPGYEVEAYQWLADQPGKVILSSLEEGYLVNYLAQKKNVFDNHFLFIEGVEEIFDDVGQIYTSSSRIEAIELLDKYDVDYIVVSKKIKDDYQIDKLSFRDEDCVRKVYRGEIIIYKNQCRVKVQAI